MASCIKRADASPTCPSRARWLPESGCTPATKRGRHSSGLLGAETMEVLHLSEHRSVLPDEGEGFASSAMEGCSRHDSYGDPRAATPRLHDFWTGPRITGQRGFRRKAPRTPRSAQHRLAAGPRVFPGLFDAAHAQPPEKSQYPIWGVTTGLCAAPANVFALKNVTCPPSRTPGTEAGGRTPSSPPRGCESIYEPAGPAVARGPTLSERKFEEIVISSADTNPNQKKRTRLMNIFSDYRPRCRS